MDKKIMYRLKGVVAYWDAKTNTYTYIETPIHDYYIDGITYTCVADIRRHFETHNKHLVHLHVSHIDTETKKYLCGGN